MPMEILETTEKPKGRNVSTEAETTTSTQSIQSELSGS